MNFFNSRKSFFATSIRKLQARSELKNLLSLLMVIALLAPTAGAKAQSCCSQLQITPTAELCPGDSITLEILDYPNCDQYDVTVLPSQTSHFIDITGTGTPIALNPANPEASVGPFPIGFDFNFYSNTFTQAYISPNGYVTFDAPLPSDVGGCCSGGQVPDDDPAEPNNLVALAWGNLSPEDAGAVYYETQGTAPNRTFIISWVDVPYESISVLNITAQIVLHEGAFDASTGSNNSLVEINSISIPPDPVQRTMGIENADGTQGVSVPDPTIVDGFRNSTPGWGSFAEKIQFIPNGVQDCVFTSWTDVNTGTVYNAAGDTTLTLFPTATTTFTARVDCGGTFCTNSVLIEVDNTVPSNPVCNDVTVTLDANSQARIDFGNAVSLDGVDDYVVVPDNPSLQWIGPVTLEAWVYPIASTGARNVIISKINNDGSGNATGFWLNMETDQTVRFIVGEGTNIGQATASSPIALNTWTHIAATFDTSLNEMKIYYGGVLQTTQTYTGNMNSDQGVDLAIGTTADGTQLPPPTNQHNFFGYIDAVRVWREARSQTLINTYINQELTAGFEWTVGNWNFNEGPPFVTSDDETIYTNDATLIVDDVNAAWVRSVNVLGDGASDNCGIESDVLSETLLDCTDVGTNTITLTVSDASGNTATCESTVTVLDDEILTVVCPDDIQTCDEVVTYPNPTWNDYCNATLVLLTPASGSLFPLGNTVVGALVTNANAGTAAGCNFTVTRRELQATIVPSDFNGVAIDCKGNDNGELTATLDTDPLLAGFPPYTFVWSTGDSTQTISGLAPGMYSVTITDSEECEVIVPDFEVTEPADTLQVATTIINSSCNAADNASILATVTGGTPPYTYGWTIGTDTDSLLNDIGPGSYDLVVTDANNCQVNVNNIEITEPDTLVVELNATAVLCFGDSDGTLATTVTGGTAPFTYLWSTGEITADISGLATGTYTVTTTDANSCTATASMMVNDGDSASETSTIVTVEQTCSSLSNGEATVDLGFVCDRTGRIAANPVDYTLAEDGDAVNEGAISPYQNEFRRARYQYLYTADELAAAGVTVGTISSLAFNLVTEQTTIALSDFTIKIGCTVDDALTPGAFVSALQTVYTADYDPMTTGWNVHAFDDTYDWDGESNIVVEVCFENTTSDNQSDIVATSATAYISTLAARNDSPTPVSGIEGCDLDNDPAEPTGNFNERPDIRFGSSNVGFLWSDGQTTQTAENLAAGDYTVTITLPNGCVFDLSATVGAQADVTATPTIVDASCIGDANGSITLAVTDGVVPYTYLWSDGSTMQNLMDVVAGTYSVTVTDSVGCEAILTDLVIAEGESLAPFVSTDLTTEVTCLGNDGEATVSIPVPCGINNRVCPSPVDYDLGSEAMMGDSISPYQSRWYDARYQYLYTADELAAAGMEEGTIGSLAFNVLAKNSTQAFTDYTIRMTCTDAEELVLGAFDPSLQIVYQADYTSTLGWNVHNLDQTFDWDGTSNLIVEVCFNNDSADFFNDLVASSSTTYTSAIGDFDDNITGIGCNLTTAGFGFARRPNIRFGSCNIEYAWSDGQTTAVASNLIPGDYTVTVTFPNGCTLDQTVTITSVSSLAVDTVLYSNENLCFGDCTATAEVVVSGGTPPYGYEWTSGDSTAIATNLCAGAYFVTITDADGCLLDYRAVVIEDGDPLSTTYTMSATPQSCPENLDGTAAIDISLACDRAGRACANPQDFDAMADGDGTDDVSLSPYQTEFRRAHYQYLYTADELLMAGMDAGTISSLAFNIIAKNSTLTIENFNIKIGCTGDTDLTAGSFTPSLQTVFTADIMTMGTGWSVHTFDDTYDWDGVSNIIVEICFENSDSEVGSDLVATSTTPYVSTISARDDSTVPVTIIEGCDLEATDAYNERPDVRFGACPIEYLWSNGETTAFIDSLTTGMYNVTLSLPNGCVLEDSVFVDILPPLEVDVDANDPLCGEGDEGFIALTVTGGTPPYDYIWSDGQTTDTAIDLIAGIYDVTVTDSLSCPFIITGIELEDGEPLATQIIVEEVTGVSCQGDDGEALVTIPFECGTNGRDCDAPTTFQVGMGVEMVDEASPFQSFYYDARFQYLYLADEIAASDLNAGTIGQVGFNVLEKYSTQGFTDFTIRITCTDLNELVIGEFDPSLQIVYEGASVNTVLGWNTFDLDETYDWDGTSNLIVEVCFNNEGPADISNDIVEGMTTDFNSVIGDFDDNVGSVGCDLTTAGNEFRERPNIRFGSCQSEFIWSDGQTGPLADGLATGTYEVTITFPNGCTVEDSVSVTAIPPLVITNVEHPDSVLCFGDCDAFAEVFAAGGTPPYTFEWTNGDTTALTDSLCAGTYGITVTDANLCVADTIITIFEPPLLLATVDVTDPLCFGGNDGFAVANPTGGTPPYFYNWSNGQTTQTATMLSLGIYAVTITDNNGCEHIEPFVQVNQPPKLLASFEMTMPLCFGGDDGSLAATGIGGTPPYTYNWSNGDTNATAENLFAGLYDFTITDANGCTEVYNDLEVTEPPLLESDPEVVDVLCHGDSTGSATTNAFGGTPPYTYLWSDGQTTDTAENLATGTYDYTVTDANGCTHTGSVFVDEPPLLVTDFSSASINNGTGFVPTFYDIAEFTFEGGLPPYNYEWTIDGFVQYETDGLGNLTVVYAEDAQWSVTVVDANGCSSDEGVASNSVLIGDPDPTDAILNIVDYTITPDDGDCTGGIEIVVTGGTQPYFYDWAGPADWIPPTIEPSGDVYNIAGLCSGWYTVTVTDSSDPEQNTVGWYWVPVQRRGRGKLSLDATQVMVQASPNPFGSQTLIDIASNTDTDAQAVLYGIDGKQIAVLFDGRLSANQPEQVSFSANGLPNGTYICQVTTASGVRQQVKLILIQ